jgi:replication fork protection complex subunit Tof1/Swi1
MASSEVYAETADILQHKLFYNGEILDLAFEGLRGYKQGSQSIAYLDTTINFAYVLLRILEKWAKNKGKMVIRRKKKAAKKKKGNYIV